MPRVASLVSLDLLTAACRDSTSTEAMDAVAATEQTLIIDTHIDISYRLHRGYDDVSKATDGGDYDYLFATMDMVLDHIERAEELGGFDLVGIGSDFDGVGDSLPIGLRDASTCGDLMDGLRGRGSSQADINKIMGGNTLRVWRAVEAYAEQMGNPAICAD